MRATRTIIDNGRRRIQCARLAAAVSIAILLATLAVSCTGSKPREPRLPKEVEVPPYLKDTVGEVARIAGREFIPVQAYGFVTGLDGTGTRVVPPGIRQEILNVMRRNKVQNPEELLASPDTAVVQVTGLLTPGIAKGEVFDLEVRAPPNTETTSLDGGFLLETDLRETVSMREVEARSEILALGRGSIFVSPFATDKKGDTADPRLGRILAGGKAVKTRQFRLALLSPSVRTVDQIIRTVNARFPDAAKGTHDPGRIDLEVPADYRDDKDHFLDLVGALYLRETAEARDRRVDLLMDTLQSEKDLDRVAISLEAFGPTVFARLRPLADHPSQTVRFYVGRTLANLQEPQAVYILERIALDDRSEFQEAAVEALGKIRSGVGLGILGRVLDAANARVRLAAWRAMARLTPETFVVRRFEDKFVLSAVATKAEPFVYVSRTSKPHIAVFGDISVRPPILAETRRVTATALADAKHLILMARRHGKDIHIEAPLDVKGLIEVLASPLAADPAKPGRGLDLGYSDVVGLLHEMAKKGALSGAIMLQPLEYRIPGDRPIVRPIEAEAGN